MGPGTVLASGESGVARPASFAAVLLLLAVVAQYVTRRQGRGLSRQLAISVRCRGRRNVQGRVLARGSPGCGSWAAVPATEAEFAFAVGLVPVPPLAVAIAASVWSRALWPSRVRR